MCARWHGKCVELVIRPEKTTFRIQPARKWWISPFNRCAATNFAIKLRLETMEKKKQKNSYYYTSFMGYISIPNGMANSTGSHSSEFHCTVHHTIFVSITDVYFMRQFRKIKMERGRKERAGEEGYRDNFIIFWCGMSAVNACKYGTHTHTHIKITHDHEIYINNNHIQWVWMGLDVMLVVESERASHPTRRFGCVASFTISF